MSAQKRTPSRALLAFVGFIGMSVVAAVLATVAVTPALAVTGMAASNSIGVFENLPSYLRLDQLDQATTIMAKNDKGKEVQLAKFWAQNRVEVSWDGVSQYVKDAALAAEDPRFYQHGGVDIEGTIRGVVSTLLKHDVQGGSSITQQYVKNVLVMKCENTETSAKAVRKCYDAVTQAHNANGNLAVGRKLQEMKYAIGLEKTSGKDQILLGYLNITGFGGTVYGIEAAAQHYYGVSAKDVTLAQAATLMAIVNNPSLYRLDQPKSTTNGAANGYAASMNRRNYILKNMLDEGKITEQQYIVARNTPIEPRISTAPKGCQRAGNAAYFCDYITWIIKHDPTFGKTATERWANFNRGGYTIESTLDLQLQAANFKAIHDRVPYKVAGGNIAAAATSVQPNTGRVLTMAQTRKYTQDPSQAKDAEYTGVNYNTDFAYGGSSGFQIGSTAKVFALTAWLKDGHSLLERVNGSVYNYNLSTFRDSCGGPYNGPYTVKNYSYGEGGVRTVLDGTIRSINSVYMAMAHQLDLCDVGKATEALDVHPAKGGGPVATNPSAVLGTGSLFSPLSIATAFAGIANKGKVCTPIAIDKITDANGKNVPPPKTTCTQGISADIAATLAYALSQVVTSPAGTAYGSRVYDGIAVLGKTGTTNESYDNMLTESSTKVASCFWVGNISGHVSLINLYPKGQRLDQIRNEVMRDIQAAANKKYGGAKSFPPPDQSLVHGVKVTVPNLTGKSLAEAQQILDGIGLGYQMGQRVDSNVPYGLVAQTSPGGGAGVSKGSVVTVYPSTGHAPQVGVPNVVGKSKADATNALQAAGFHVAISGPAQDGTVTVQSPGGNQKAAPGSTVTLTLTPDGKGGPPVKQPPGQKKP